MIIHKFLLSFVLFFSFLLSPSFCFAGVEGIPGKSYASSSVTAGVSGDSPIRKIQNLSLAGFRTLKVVINGLAVVYLVYVGSMMVIAFGAEDQIAKQKKQLLYVLTAFLFINIPGYIFAMFGGPKSGNITESAKNSDFTGSSSVFNNIFVSYENWEGTITGSVIWFMRVGIIGYAVFMFILSSIMLIAAGGDEERKGKAKNRIISGVLGLIFLGVIEAFVRFAYTGDFGKGQGIVSQLANLALFFIGPIAIFFLIYAGWLIITSAGDEERVKKGKKIVTQVALAVLLLLASYTFLGDLASFKL